MHSIWLALSSHRSSKSSFDDLRSETGDGRPSAAYQGHGGEGLLRRPHSTWQRGINENTYGLLRQYLPKGADLSSYTQAQPDAIASQLNARPRKSMGYHCPAELFAPDAFDFKQHDAALFALGK